MSKLFNLSLLLFSMFLSFGTHATPVNKQNISMTEDQKTPLLQKLAWKQMTNKIKKKYNGNLLDIKGCEKIQLKNGIQLDGEIIDADVNHLTYIRCDETEETQMQLSLGEVEKIFTEKGDNIYNDVNFKDERNENLSMAAVVLGVLGLIPFYGVIFSVLAILFGFIAKRNFKDRPEKEWHLKKAKAGIVLGFIGVAATTIFTFWLAANCCG